MLLQVVGYAEEECLVAKVRAQHANDGATLEVGDVIKDLVDLEGIADGNFNRMRVADRVEGEGLLERFRLVIEYISDCTCLPLCIERTTNCDHTSHSVKH